jgi:hypothetical protein
MLSPQALLDDCASQVFFWLVIVLLGSQTRGHLYLRVALSKGSLELTPHFLARRTLLIRPLLYRLQADEYHEMHVAEQKHRYVDTRTETAKRLSYNLSFNQSYPKS